MIAKQIEEIKSLIEKTVSIPAPPVLGKVEKVYEVAGKSDFLNCLYSADVRLIELTEGGDFRDSDIVIPDVPILGIGLGNNRGIFFLPEKGSIVKVSFLYGCLSYPVIDGILPYRKSVPQHEKDNLQINVPKDKIEKVGNNKTEEITGLWSGAYNKVELTAPSGFFFSGNVQITGNLTTTGNITASGQISDLGGTKGSLSDLRNTYNSHTHPGDSGGTTGTPDQTV